MITLNLPPGINATYAVGGRHFYKKAIAKDWEKEARYEIFRQWKRKTIVGPTYVGINLFYIREPDIDAYIKIVLDILTMSSVYNDDKQIIHLNVKKQRDTHPRVEIEIEPVIAV